MRPRGIAANAVQQSSVNAQMDTYVTMEDTPEMQWRRRGGDMQQYRAAKCQASQ